MKSPTYSETRLISGCNGRGEQYSCFGIGFVVEDKAESKASRLNPCAQHQVTAELDLKRTACLSSHKYVLKVNLYPDLCAYTSLLKRDDRPRRFHKSDVGRYHTSVSSMLRKLRNGYMHDVNLTNRA